MFENHIDLLDIDCHTWRKSKLWNQHCDEVYNRLLPFLKRVYEKYSGKVIMPGQPKTMSLDEFF